MRRAPGEGYVPVTPDRVRLRVEDASHSFLGWVLIGPRPDADSGRPTLNRLFDKCIGW